MKNTILNTVKIATLLFLFLSLIVLSNSTHNVKADDEEMEYKAEIVGMKFEPVEPIVLNEGENGKLVSQYRTVFEKLDFKYVYYFEYDTDYIDSMILRENNKIIISYDDGSSETLTCINRRWVKSNNDVYVPLSYRVRYPDQYSKEVFERVGSGEIDTDYLPFIVFSYNGFEQEYDISITKNNIDNISFVLKNDIEIEENTHGEPVLVGDLGSYYDYDYFYDESYIEKQLNQNGNQFIITYKDNTKEIFTSKEGKWINENGVVLDDKIFIDSDSAQYVASNPRIYTRNVSHAWWGVGDYETNVYYKLKKTRLKIKITPSTVNSIDFVTDKEFEKTDDIYREGNKLTVKLTSGLTKEYICKKINGSNVYLDETGQILPNKLYCYYIYPGEYFYGEKIQRGAYIVYYQNKWSTVKINYTDKGSKQTNTKKNTAKRLKTRIKKLKAKKKSIKVAWKKVVGAAGYKVQYSLNKKFKKPKQVLIKNNKFNSKTIKGLKSKKVYYFRVKTFIINNNHRVFSKWSKTKSKKTK